MARGAQWEARGAQWEARGAQWEARGAQWEARAVVSAQSQRKRGGPRYEELPMKNGGGVELMKKVNKKVKTPGAELKAKTRGREMVEVVVDGQMKKTRGGTPYVWWSKQALPRRAARRGGQPVHPPRVKPVRDGGHLGRGRVATIGQHGRRLGGTRR